MNLNKKWYFILILLLASLAVWWFFFKRTSKQASKLPTAKNSFEEKLFFRKDLTNEQKMFLRAVAMHETGKYSSTLFKQANNAFGMRPNQFRTKWYDGVTSGNYARYSDFNASINDVKEWMDKYIGGVPVDENGVDLMKQKGYFEDTLMNYKTAVSKYMQA